MSHLQVFKDTFETMMLITLKGNVRRDERMNFVIRERIAQKEIGWIYDASYDVEDKTYIVFNKAENLASGYYRSGNSHYPIYC